MAGRVALVKGGKKRDYVDLSKEMPELLLAGNEAGDYTGFAQVGDFDGDGEKDLLVGAPFADADCGNNAGKAYVIHGAGFLTGAFEVGSGISDHVIDGEEEGDFSGYVFTGDLDSDGMQEIMVSALGADGIENLTDRAGEIRIFFNEGRSGLDELATRVVTVVGKDRGDRFGHQPRTGDLNNDGIGELIVPVASGDGPLNNRPSSGEIVLVYPSAVDEDEDEDNDVDDGEESN
jgi:hypothetical protein